MMKQALSKSCARGLRKRSSAATAVLHRGFASSKPEPPTEPQPKQQAARDGTTTASDVPKAEKPVGHRKTMAEIDEEMRMKMSGIAGDGGEAGIEYEDGQPVAMKRSVKNNMFRYI